MKKYLRPKKHHDENDTLARAEGVTHHVSESKKIKNDLRVAKGKTEKEIEREVRELYADDDGNLPDLTIVSRVQTHRLRNFFIGLFALCVVGGSVGWAVNSLVFQKKPLIAPEVTVDVPSTVKSGETAFFNIHYSAPRKTGISSLEIDVQYPETFVVKSTDQSTSSTDHWVIKNIPAGSEGDIHIVGVVRGGDSAPQLVRAHVSYIPENFQSPFELVATNAFSIAGSLVQISSIAPDRVMPGDAVAVQFTYKNPGAENIQDSVFRITIPPGFVVSTSSQATLGQFLWKVPVLNAGSSSTAKVVGTFASDVKGVFQCVGEFGVLRGNEFIPQSVSVVPITVLGGDLVLTTLVNGSTSSTPVHAGDTLRMTLAYANRSEATLEDVRLVLNLTDGTGLKNAKILFDPQSIHTSIKGVFTTSTQSLVWTKKQIPGLAKLKPGEEGVVDVTVKLVDATDISKMENALTVAFQGSIAGVNGIAKKRQVQAGSLVFPFLSDVNISSEARYFNTDEIAVGSGPIPPKVGSETLYRVYWTITNSLHEIQNVEAHATLPKGTRYTGKQNVSAGVLSYDEKTRIITWSINKLPAKAPIVNVDFEIGITPIQGDVGKVLPLLGETSLSSKDIVANAVLTKTANELDTSVPSDALGKGNGIVVSGDPAVTEN